MPNLPTYSVDQPVADAMLESFGSVENYLKFRKKTDAQFVIDKELAKIDTQFNEHMTDLRVQFETRQQELLVAKEEKYAELMSYLPTEGG